MSEKQRTLTQNASLHQLFKDISDTLNDHGLDIRATLKEDFEIPWSPELVKEIVWKSIQKIVVGTDKTSKLEKQQIDKVYVVINMWLGKHGLHVPFPSNETKHE